MNSYTQKQIWKIILLGMAFLIVIGSLWYSNSIVKRIETEEKKKITLWAEAIKNKSKLVNYTSQLFSKLRNEERKKVELWALGTKQITSPTVDVSNLSFVLEVIKNNTTVPVIIADENDKVLFHRNLDSAQVNDVAYLKQELFAMKSAHPSIVIDLGNKNKQLLYYKDSKIFTELQEVLNDLIQSFISEIVVNSVSVPVLLTDVKQQKIIASGNIDTLKIKTSEQINNLILEMKSENEPIAIELEQGTNYIMYQNSELLRKLKLFPYLQFGIIGLFLLIAYTLFNTSRRSEQNQVWVGMSKETAHQLGTPLSSLMAWIDILRAKEVDEATLEEIQKDVNRLQTITERFSKIGSVPQLEEHLIGDVLNNSVEYLQARLSKKVKFEVLNKNASTSVPVNVPLFEWVIENLVKNAVDAMEGEGKLTLTVSEEPEWVNIDIQDTGKGIPRNKFKAVFEPGYTSKKRGWGLGLSLAKRIIEEYHNGKIYVKSSEIDKGTTFRISLAA